MYLFDLQIFDEGNNGAGAGTGNGSQTTAGGNGTTGTGGSYSFEQAEEIANARAERATRAALSSYFKQQGMSETEVTEAINAFKANREKQKPDVNALTQERDQARKELAELKQAQKLQSKGIRAEDVDYVQFKIIKLMDADDKLDFDKALAKFLKENPRYATSGEGSYRMRSGTSSSDEGSAGSRSASINDAIRRAARR